MALALGVGRLERAHRGGGGRGDARGQGRGEDELRRVGAHRVDERRRAGDVAAEPAEALGERAFDDVEFAHQAFALGDAAAARAVHADRMDLVDIGHRAIFLGQRDDRGDRRDVAVHRIEALEHDQLGALDRLGGEQLFEMGDVVVAPDLLVAAGAPDALDHRIVVERVGEDEAIRQQAGDGRDAGEIGDPARGEDERRLLAVQVGELALEHDDRMMGAGDVAGAAGAGAVGARRLDARLDDVGVDAHAEIVVRAPDGDRTRRVLFARRAPHGRGGSGRRRARGRRRRDSALRFSGVRSLPQNDADNPSVVDPSSRPPGGRRRSPRHLP